MPKRGANIYKRKDNRWEGRYIKCYDNEGRKKYGYIYGASYAEAKERLQKVKGELSLFELSWLSRHLSGNIFRIGRLQYCKGWAKCDIPELGVKKSDPIIEVHIPRGEKLTAESAKASLDEARTFFATHFKSYDYKCFTTDSWLLDDTLKKYLPEDSGILQFASLFTAIHKKPSFELLKYIFSWDTTVLNLRHRYPCSSLASAVQRAVLKGESFYEVYGAIPK